MVITQPVDTGSGLNAPGLTRTVYSAAWRSNGASVLERLPSARTRRDNQEFNRMTSELRRIPPGPTEKYNTSHDLLNWMSDQFNQFGSIYRASVYGADVYVVSDPEHADHVLRTNWQNYRKGLAIKRIGLLLGTRL